MESLVNIVDYIDNMKIKTAFLGGFDKESVYSVIQDISSMYQKHISDLQRENSKLKYDIETISSEAEVSFSDQRQFELAILSAEASKKEVEALNIKLAEAEDTIESAKEEMITLTKRLKEAESRAAAAESTAKELEEKYSNTDRENSYIRERFDTLDAAIRVVKESEERAVADARQKADSIIDDAKQEATRIVEDGAKEYDRISREVMVLKEMKTNMEQSVADISFRIKDLYLKTDELRRRYAPDEEDSSDKEDTSDVLECADEDAAFEEKAEAISGQTSEESEPAKEALTQTTEEEASEVENEEPAQDIDMDFLSHVDIPGLTDEDKAFLMKLATFKSESITPKAEENEQGMANE